MSEIDAAIGHTGSVVQLYHLVFVLSTIFLNSVLPATFIVCHKVSLSTLFYGSWQGAR